MTHSDDAFTLADIKRAVQQLRDANIKPVECWACDRRFYVAHVDPASAVGCAFATCKCGALLDTDSPRVVVVKA